MSQFCGHRFCVGLLKSFVFKLDYFHTQFWRLGPIKLLLPSAIHACLSFYCIILNQSQSKWTKPWLCTKGLCEISLIDWPWACRQVCTCMFFSQFVWWWSSNSLSSKKRLPHLLQICMRLWVTFMCFSKYQRLLKYEGTSCKKSAAFLPASPSAPDSPALYSSSSPPLV